MKVILLIAVTALLLVFGWRRLSRSVSLPCPWWMTKLLDNPYMNTVAGASLILDRAGVKPGMRVLDIGCGPGRISIPAGELVGTDGLVVAVDIQAKMLRKLEERSMEKGLTNIRPVQAGAGEGKMRHNVFHRAFLVTVLGEIPDREKALREIYDSLVPGGILSITEVLPDPHYQKESEIRRLSEKAGFQLERKFGNFLAFTLNFVKNGNVDKIISV